MVEYKINNDWISWVDDWKLILTTKLLPENVIRSSDHFFLALFLAIWVTLCQAKNTVNKININWMNKHKRDRKINNSFEVNKAFLVWAKIEKAFKR